MLPLLSQEREDESLRPPMVLCQRSGASLPIVFFYGQILLRPFLLVKNKLKLGGHFLAKQSTLIDTLHLAIPVVFLYSF